MFFFDVFMAFLQVLSCSFLFQRRSVVSSSDSAAHFVVVFLFVIHKASQILVLTRTHINVIDVILLETDLGMRIK